MHEGSLGDKVAEVRLSQRLKSHPVCLTAKGGLSIEMEKVLNSMPVDQKIQAERVLEINAKHPILETLNKVYGEDKEAVKKYAKLLYDQALLIEGLPVEDPVAFSNAVCELMTNKTDQKQTENVNRSVFFYAERDTASFRICYNIAK